MNDSLSIPKRERSAGNDGDEYAGWYRWDEATRKWIAHPDPEAGPSLSEREIAAPLYERRRAAGIPT